LSVVVAGEALYDLVLGHDGRLAAHPGGGPFNAARAVARLDQPAVYLGRVSTDALGARLLRVLERDGVDSSAVVPTGDPTTLAVAELGPGGQATYRFYTEGTAAAGLTPEQARAALPETVDSLLVGTLGLAVEPLADAMEALAGEVAGRAIVAVDPNCRPAAIRDEGAYRERLTRVLALADVVKVSAEDLAWLDPGTGAEQAALRLLGHGPVVALLTLGPDGAVALTESSRIAVPAPAIHAVDTIGAGDAFAGAFLAWWRARGLDPPALADRDTLAAALRFAVLVSARTCERAGAEPPTLGEL
jgi:fructokinase